VVPSRREVYPRWYIPGYLGGRYTIVYIPYYALPGTPCTPLSATYSQHVSAATSLPVEEALGSNPEKDVGMRRIQHSFSQRCEERCVSAHRVAPLLRDKVRKDRIDEGSTPI